MESHEEKLHKLIIQSKVNETKDVMKRKAQEIDKYRMDARRMGAPASDRSMAGMSGKRRGQPGWGTARSRLLLYQPHKRAPYTFQVTSGRVCTGGVAARYCILPYILVNSLLFMLCTLIR